MATPNADTAALIAAAREERRPLWRVLLPPLIAIGVVGGGLWQFAPQTLQSFHRARLHQPDWALFSGTPLAFQLHVASAAGAILVGTVVLLLPKGVGLHKFVGWSWVLAMLSTAITSLFMTGLNGDSYSIIHLLSGWTLVMLPLGIFFIRNRRVAAHQRVMTGVFYGGLLVAGALTFIPGRFMFQLFFG